MIIKIFLILVITLLFYIKAEIPVRFKIILQPIVITPIVGMLWGVEGVSTGITVGVIVELIWGRNSIVNRMGLKYNLLVSLLSLATILLTENISLFFNLTLIVILVFAFQESVGYLEAKRYFIFLVFLFNILIMLSMPLFKSLLGMIPAQFLNELAVSGGAFVPIIGLALFMVDIIKEEKCIDLIHYYSYGISTIVVSVFLFNSFYFSFLIFPIIYYFLKYFWEANNIEKRYLRVILLILLLMAAPLLVEWNVSFLSTRVEYFLWIEVVLVLFSILGLFKLTPIEGYFIISLLGIIGAKVGILV